MDSSGRQERHWLVVGWPGMSNVALIACGYLVKSLGLKPVAVIDGAGRFEVGAVTVRGGRVNVPEPARTLLYSGRVGESGPTVTVLLAEAQPDHEAMRFARDLIDRARQMGANHVMSFAAVATQLEPTQEPRVYSAVTSDELAAEATEAEITPLGEGEIGGMNGLTVGAAALAGLPGVCLLGEIPYYAVRIANPGAASAVIGAFTRMTGIEVDRTEIEGHAERINQILVQLRERMASGSTEPLNIDDLVLNEGAEAATEGEPMTPAPKSEGALELSVRRRVEELFETARKDHTKAMDLKQELDRLGVFKQYEDRFLDLFRRAG